MLNNNLKACPHCGCLASLRVASRLGAVDSDGYKHTEYFVLCDTKIWGSRKGCGAQGGSQDTWDEAINHWNLRFP